MQVAKSGFRRYPGCVITGRGAFSFPLAAGAGADHAAAGPARVQPRLTQSPGSAQTPLSDHVCTPSRLHGAIICLAQLAQVGGQAGGGGQGVGVVVAQDAAAAVEGVVVQVAGGLDLAERAQVGGQVVGGVQGVGVVVAQDAAAAVEGVVVQVAGGLDLAERAQVVGQVVGGVQGVGVVLAQDAAAAVQGVVVQVAGGLRPRRARAGRGPGWWRRTTCCGGRGPGCGGGGPGCLGSGRGRPGRRPACAG